ncbi:hypothetical protein [Fibrella arboris]|uniref:hypothetical protein n=1 Tax=Fibrella arboris TaxID=3242486 RepID=UPI003521FCC8
MTREDGWLVALWLLISALIGGLSYVNPTHFLSPDSAYYLSFAGWLVGLDGDQYGHVTSGWEGTFPVGYPLLIGTLAKASGTSLLVASKLLNSLSTGVFLLIWRNRVGARRAIWVGSVCLLGGFLRLLAYTWSEWVFVVLLLEWLWSVSRPVTAGAGSSDHYRFVARLFLLTSGLFLLRYVGGYVVLAYGLQALGTYRHIDKIDREKRFGADLLYAAASITFMLGYFYLNYRLTHSPYGGERFVNTTETIGEKVALITLAVINEGLLVRDFIPGESVILVLLGAVLQGLLIGWIWPRLNQQRDTLPNWSPTDRQLLRTYLVSAGTYLALLFALRLFSPYSGPNARLMAPASFPFLVILTSWISCWHNVVARRQLGYWWTVLLLCSWLQLLPQADLWQKFTQVWAR